MTTIEPKPTPRSRPASRFGRMRLALWIIVGVALLGVGGYWLGRKPPTPSSAADDYASTFGGPFTMVDQNGRTVTDRSLRGKPYAIFFGFTRCPDVCPTTLSRMAQLRKRLGPDGSKFDILFVSVDRGRDSARGIGNYLTLCGTPIIGLTGTEAQLAQIVKAFHVYYEKVPVEGGDYTIDHTASIYLMDRAGRFVTTIDRQEDERVALEKLLRVIAA